MQGTITMTNANSAATLSHAADDVTDFGRGDGRHADVCGYRVRDGLLLGIRVRRGGGFDQRGQQKQRAKKANQRDEKEEHATAHAFAPFRG